MTVAEIILFVIGLLGASLFVLGVFHVPFVVTMAIVIIVCVRAGFSRPVKVARDRQPVLTLITIIPLLALTITASIVPLDDFDGRAFWLLKAKALATERSIDGPFFHDNEPRNQYPLLMPLDAAMVMMATGKPDDRYARWLYLFTFAALVFFIRDRLGPWYAAILAWLPQFAVASDGGALSAYSDIAVAAFVACAFFELLEARLPIRFGMWLSFLLLTKNEGLPIAVILFVIGAFSFRRRIAVSAIPVVIAAAALFAWRSGIPKTDEENYLALLPALPSHLDRIVPAIAESAKHVFLPANWGLLWIAVVMAMAIMAWRREWRAPAVLASMAALYIGAYMVTQWTMRDLIAASADRLVMQMIGPALYAIAAVISPSSAASRHLLPAAQGEGTQGERPSPA